MYRVTTAPFCLTACMKGFGSHAWINLRWVIASREGQPSRSLALAVKICSTTSGKSRDWTDPKRHSEGRVGNCRGAQARDLLCQQEWGQVTGHRLAGASSRLPQSQAS